MTCQVNGVSRVRSHVRPGRTWDETLSLLRVFCPRPSFVFCSLRRGGGGGRGRQGKSGAEISSGSGIESHDNTSLCLCTYVMGISQYYRGRNAKASCLESRSSLVVRLCSAVRVYAEFQFQMGMTTRRDLRSQSQLRLRLGQIKCLVRRLLWFLPRIRIK